MPVSEPTLFDSPPAPSERPQVPSAAAVIQAGLTPYQWFERRYPRARNVRGQVLKDVVREGVAAPCARSAWEAFYREHWGAPIEVPLPSVHEVHQVHGVHS